MIPYININGALVPSDKPFFPATTRAISYGDGCFETIRSYKGKFLHFKDHFERLQAGLSYLEMKSDLSEEKLRHEIQKLLEINKLESEDVVVRVQCIREGASGYANLSDQSVFIISLRSIKKKKDPLVLKSVSVRAIPSIALDRKVKLSNSINYIKSAQEAKRKGGNDALMLTVNEKVSETTIANIFWVKGNQVFTPSVNCDLLPGVTRSILIELIENDEELSLLEGEFELNDVYEAEAMFCCNSVMEIKSVSGIDDCSYKAGHPIIEKLKNNFKVFKENSLEDGWKH